MKSYNTRALRGEEYNDVEFQSDMRGSNVNIPDSLLFKPEMNDYVLNEMRKQNIMEMTNDIDPRTKLPYTPDAARKEADLLHGKSKDKINVLLKRS
jgi:hypothetical protein